MYKNDITPIQIFRQHLHLRQILNAKGTVLAFTDKAENYIGIVQLENGIKIPALIAKSNKITVGAKIIIKPRLQQVSTKGLKEYGIIAKIYE